MAIDAQKYQEKVQRQETREEKRLEKSRIREENSERLSQIRQVLRKNHITRGVSPEKLRTILEELGPTYIKLGQIMSLHSDILPQRYCDELLKLNSDVTPMPFSEVEKVLEKAYGEDWHEIFSSIEETPLGSASIAQVHRAKLKTGEDVVVKVQREGIYETMSRDMRLLHRAVRLLPPVGDLKNLVDLDMVLDEMWSIAKEEMDFVHEAANMEEFRRNNRDVVYVDVPKLYSEYSTGTVLVMEYIDGIAINDKKALLDGGYDLHEIGRKYVDNFIRQVMDDGFFHADPHPGNVKIRGGKIVWIDMGMMGRFSDRDRKIMADGVRGIAMKDVTMVENAVIAIGDFRGKPDRARLYSDLKEFLLAYGSMSMGSVNVPEVLQVLMDIMKENRIRLPHGVTMLCRGLTHVQGVLTEIAPDINMMEIAATRISEEMIKNLDLRREIDHELRDLYRAGKKGQELPGLVNDVLKEYLRGQGWMNISIQSSEDFSNLVFSSIRNIVIGVCIAALLVASSIICTTDMAPKILGIPFLGFAGYAFALAASVFLTLRYIVNKVRRKRNGS